MPNWVHSAVIVVNGSATEVFDLVRGENSVFDFNKLIPMPNDIRPPAELEGKFIGDFMTPHRPFEQWAKDNWGTKWNAVDAYVVTPDERRKTHQDRLEAILEARRREAARLAAVWGLEADEAEAMLSPAPPPPKQPLDSAEEALLKVPVLYFETAWVPPVPVYEALAARFSSHEIVIWADEYDNHQHGTFTLKQGQVVFEGERCKCFEDEYEEQCEEARCAVSTPRKGRCPEIATHEDADGQMFCGEHWSQQQGTAESSLAPKRSS